MIRPHLLPLLLGIACTQPADQPIPPAEPSRDAEQRSQAKRGPKAKHPGQPKAPGSTAVSKRAGNLPPEVRTLVQQLAVPQETKAVLRALLRYQDMGGRVDLDAAIEQAAAATQQQPGYPYLHFLSAFARRLEGDADAEREALLPLKPEERAAYAMLFDGAEETNLQRQRCLYVTVCLFDQARARGTVRLDNPWGLLLEASAPTRCGGFEVEPASCSMHSEVLGRYAAISSASTRLSTWGPGTEGLDAAGFADLVGIQPGDRVADLGAGQGWFSFPIARHVGQEGMVVALEVDPQVITLLEHQIEATGQDNLRVVASRPDDIGVEPGSLDWILAIEVLGLIMSTDTKAMAAGAQPSLPVLMDTLSRSLAPGGKLVVVDIDQAFHPWDGPGGGQRAVHWRGILTELGFEEVDLIERVDGRYAARVYQPIPRSSPPP